jgi:tripartite-type tricarboxylate transporter receptor subunit TctC
MRLPRRKLLHLAAGAAALPAVSRVACAQSYPARPVRIIVGFAPSGATDIMARLIGQWLSERLSQQFIIENRPGAGSNIGTEAVVNAPPDGYTLLVGTSVNAINAALYGKLNFNFIRDITPVASIHREPFVMEVNPDKINMASAGIGSGNHVAGELFKMMTGVKLVHVPYRGGGPALIDLLGGQVQVMFATMSSSIEYIRAGKLRALAVTTATRSPALPDTRTVGDFVPGYEASFWTGVGAPKDTPADIIDKVNTEINGALADPKLKVRLADLGGTPLPGSPADFGRFIVDETEKWAKVVKFADIKLD